MKRLILIAALSTAGCTNTSDAMATWVGAPESRLLSAWGAPDKQAITDDGMKVMTWNGRNGYGRVVCARTFTLQSSRVSSFNTDCI